LAVPFAEKPEGMPARHGLHADRLCAGKTQPNPKPERAGVAALSLGHSVLALRDLWTWFSGIALAAAG